MKRTRRSRALFFSLQAAPVVSLSLVGLLAPSAQATARTWNGATGGAWPTSTNWTSTAGTPTTSDALTILGPANTAGALNIDINAASAGGSVNITDTSAVTLTDANSGSNQTLTLGSSGTNGLTTGTGAVTFGSATANQAVNVALGANQTWTIGSGGLTVDNAVSGAYTLTEAGTGTLTLGGTSTYTGGTTVSSGTLSLTGSLTGSGNNILVNGGTFSESSAGVIGTAAGTYTQTSGSSTLQGANTYTGATIIGTAGSTASGGTLTVSGAGGSISSSTSATVNGVGSQLRLDYAGITTPGSVNRFGDSASVTLNYGGEFFMGGNNASTNATETIGTLTLGTGAGIVTLSNGGGGTSTVALTASGFSRGSNFATGLVRGLSLGSTGATNNTKLIFTSTAGLTQVGTSTSSSGIAGSNTTLTIVPYLLGSNSTSLTGTNFVTYDTSTGIRLLGAAEQVTLSAPYTTQTNHDNVIAFNGSLTNASGIAVNSLLFNAASALNSTGSHSLTVDSGAVALVTSNAASIGSGFSGLTLGNGEGVVTATQGTLTINTPISVTSSGGLTTTGVAGTVVLGASNLYTGQTTVNQGTLQIGTGTAGDLGSNTANIVLNGGTLSFGRTNAGLTIANNISGVGAVTQSGTGTTTLSGSNTYTGATSISAGTVSLTGSIVGSNITTSGTGVISETSGGVIGGSGSTFTQGSSGTSTLSGSNTGTGSVTLSAGTLLLQANSGNTSVGVTSALSNSATEVLLNANTTLALQGNTTNTIFEPAGGGNTLTTGIEEAATVTLPADGPFNFSAGDTDSGTTTGKTLILGDFGDLGPPGTQPTFNFAVNNGYTLKIGDGASATTALLIFNNTTINSTATGGTLSIAGLSGNHNGSVYTFLLGGIGNISSGAINNGPSGGVDLVNEEGPGTTTLTAANTYTGATTVYLGTLDFNSGTISTGASTLTINGGTLKDDYTGLALTTSMLDASDVLALGGSGGTFVVNGAATNTTNSQTLASLTLTGAGTVQMINNNSSNNNTGLTFASSTITRSTGGSVNFVEPASGTSITFTGGGGATASGAILAPYAFFTGGSNAQTYAGLNASNAVVAATLASAGSGANSFTSATTSYSYTSPGATDTLTASASAFAADFNTGPAQTISLGTSNYNLSINGILNTGGTLTIQNGSGGTGSVTIPATAGGNTELVIGGSSNVTISAPITGTSGILSDDNTGTLTLSGANTYTGASYFNAGTTSLATTGSITGGGAITVGYGASLTEASGATISGASSLTSNGTAVNLAGSNTYTGSTAINTGILTVTGTLSPASGTTSTITIGNTLGLGAAVYQSGTSTVKNTSTGGGGFQIGSTGGAFGYYNLSGGTINVGGEIDPGGSAGGFATFGEFDMSGGTVNLPAIAGTYFLPNRGGYGESAIVNISGGTVQIAGGATETASGINGLTANWGAGGQDAQITISGTGQFITPSLLVKLNDLANATNVAALNLGTGSAGGTLQTLGFGTAINQATPAGNVNAVLNFNGGILKAGTAANTSFLTGLGAVNVYSGNGAIDNNGQAITISQAIAGASGTGVSSVAVAAGGSGYIAPPQVLFTGGTTVGGLASNAATGYATISPTTGAVTGIVITNPGSYTSITGLGVGLVSEGGVTPATLGALTTNGGNTSGGLTFQGAGTTTLTGANTYTGTTTVNYGTLQIGNGTTGSLNGTSGTALTFGGTGTFNVDEASGTNQGMGALTAVAGDGTVQSTYVGSGNSAVTFSSLAARSVGATQNFVTNLGSNGSTNSIVLTGTNAGFIDQGSFYDGGTGSANYAWMNGAGTYVRGISYTASTGDTGAYTTGATTSIAQNGVANGGGNTLYAQATGAISAQTSAIFTTLNVVNSTNTAQAFTLASGATLTTNGILRSGNGGSSGTITISGGTALQAANNAELVIRTDQSNDPLTISTPIQANGTNALTKSGAGVLTLTASNTYTGATYINAGTLTLSNGSSVANTSAIAVSSGATLKLISTVTGPTTVNLINDSAIVYVNGTNAISLNLNGNTENVALFLINGVDQPIGTYSATGGTGANAVADESYFVSSGNSGFLDVTSVPEPGSLSLLALGGLGLMRRRRRVPNLGCSLAPDPKRCLQ